MSNTITNYWLTPTTTEKSSTTGSNSLSDFDSFIQLLATELQYQDPTDPVSSTEYVSQMAQINSLEALQNIYTGISNTAAFDMIGQEVAYQITDASGNVVTYTGTVQSVISYGGNTYLNVDGTAVTLDCVVEVGNISDSGDTTATA
ncbi:flagellar hook capping FlgD N-terminal domain-containing protein [Acetonema longum]|uniref:Flagellar hook capping protein n=1 Tax=Acetonema longum DSM 6540 TaxID=1009370 RepID=F7NH10_9FIRM|nr:flagellar hook capping FlgD N-terminal domain-containing protein [Acetonema longum]EGO64741.1 flagellar hook capping protein [Acetonema longum DSM 6540]